MLMEAKNNIRYIKNALKCNLKSIIEYRTSFIIQALFMFINNGFYLIFWNVVFGINNNQINDINMKEIYYLWSIPTISYGFVYLLFGGISNISKNIVTGGMDSYLTQPKNIFINIATSRCDFSACGDLLYGLVIGIAAVSNINEYLLILGYSIIGAIIHIATMTIIRSLAVFLGDIEEMAERYEHTFLITFTVYPEEIFGKIVKIILYTLVPAGYIAHLPIRLIFNFNLTNFIGLIIATVVYVLIAIVMFKKVLKNYESGNAMALKG